MPFYHKLGNIPHKRHTQHRRPDGKLYTEELFGTEGFSGNASLLYHHHPPVHVVSYKGCGKDDLEEWTVPTGTRRIAFWDTERFQETRWGPDGGCVFDNGRGVLP